MTTNKKQMKPLLIKNAKTVNEGRVYNSHIFCRNGIIERIIRKESVPRMILDENPHIIDASGKILIPGVIDDQVHFREPGLTHKGDIATESAAAAAGGITSFMEMPNTVPPCVTNELLEDKFRIASENSITNYSFYLGATNDNLDELLIADPSKVCGIKVFMGSSTGNMLVDNRESLEKIFSAVKLPVAVHCEDEQTIRKNSAEYREKYGKDVPVKMHAAIRSEEACYISSSYAVELAEKYGTRLHILHMSTARETGLLKFHSYSAEKNITAEACIHHLWFDESDYERLGSKIKWNPSVKSSRDREALRRALISGKIDVIATDHAPHTKDEKAQKYFDSPSGGPMVQHSLPAMFELVKQGVFSHKLVVEKMCHAPALLFGIEKRGFIREGYFADLVLVDPDSPWKVSRDNILYKCGWSPFEGFTFGTSVTHTIINGNIVYENGEIDYNSRGKQLTFNR